MGTRADRTSSGEPSEAAKSPPLSRHDVDRAAQLHAAALASLAAPKRSRSWRPSRRRLLIWGIELAILLAVVERVLIRPAFQSSRETEADPPVRLAPGDPLEPLAGRALLLPGLEEVQPAYRISTRDLAPGSEVMAEAQVSFSKQSCLPVEVRNSLGMHFRLIPPGRALLGSPDGEPGRGEVETQHEARVYVPFYMGTCEVSQQEWSALIPENPSAFAGADRPVEEISWYDCQHFLGLLCEREGLPETTYRLPTEVEWEYACRAGTTRAYFFGDDPDDLERFAEYAGNNYRCTMPVGGKPPNALGLSNLHGNVWEWCLNRFGTEASDQTPSPDTASWRAIRGGNWYVPASDCRSAERTRLPPASKGNMLGFRVLRTIPESTFPATTPSAAAE